MAGESGLSTGTWDDAHLVNAIVDIHRDDPEFGYRFISDELEKAGHAVGEGRVHRLCKRAPDLVGDHEEGPQRLTARSPDRPSTTTW